MTPILMVTFNQMSMKKFSYLASLFILATLAGCQNEEDVLFNDNTSKQTEIIVTASLGGNEKSRTALDESGKLYWSENDNLSVFLGLKEGLNQQFALIEGAGTKEASFQGKNGQIIIGSSSTGNYTWANVAYYPYAEDITITKSESTYKLNVTLPAIQSYASNSFGQGTFPMVAVTEDKNDYEFVFNNVASIVRLNLTGDATITKVTLKSESMPLAGAAVVEASTSNAVLTMDKEGDVTSTLLLDCGEGVAINNETATSFVFVIPPDTYPKDDLTFTVYDSNDKYQSYTINSEVQFNPNGVKDANRTYEAKSDVVKVQLNGSGNYSTIADAVSAISDKNNVNTITLAAGTYTLPTSLSGLNLVIEGADDELLGETVIDMSSLSSSNTPQYDVTSLTFKNMTVKRPNGAYGGLSHSTAEHFDNCIIEGTLVTYAPTVTAKNSTFKQISNAYYNVHIYAAGTFEFEKCKFICEGKSFYMHHDENQTGYDVTVTNCTFTANQTVTGKTAIQMHTEGRNGDNGVYGKLTISGTTATGFDSSINNGLWYELNNSTKNLTYNFNITVDGEKVWPGFTVDEDGNYEIYSKLGLKWFADQVNNGNSFSGVTLTLTEPIDLSGEKWTPIGSGSTTFYGTFDGGNQTISNMKVTAEDNSAVGLFASALGVVKNVKMTDVTIVGHYKAGAIVGDGECAKIEGCSVERGSITVTPLNNDNGQHAGGITGYLAAEPNAYVKNCSVSDLTITAYRDLGGVVGTATADESGTPVVTGNTVSGVSLIANQSDTYGEENKAPNVGAIVGRVEVETTLSDNTTTSVAATLKGVSLNSGIETADIANWTLNGVTLTPTEGNALTLADNANVNLTITNNVTLTGATGGDGIEVPETAAITISGTGTLVVKGNGGTEDTSVIGGSAIGNADANAGNITISGLTKLTAEGWGKHAYGIGGLNATVSISNTTVTYVKGGCVKSTLDESTYGKNEPEGGAAIGGEKISLTGTAITKAEGGSKAAAIGAQYWNGTEIEIDNCNLKNILGGNASAAIGGSRYADTSKHKISIKIKDSAITATGGQYGAGIGSGYDVHCNGQNYTATNYIEITGNSVLNVEGGKYAAGIGTGYHSAYLSGYIESGVNTTYVTAGASRTDKYTVTQNIGYGVVDSSREFQGTNATITFKVGDEVISTPTTVQ